jgi:HlyD family secretion protein
MRSLLRAPIALFLLTLLLIAAGIVTYRQVGMTDPQQQYRLESVGKGEITQLVSANGTINPVSLISVGTQVSGIVKKLYVDFNDKVEKGQILLELDDSLLAAQQKQSRANAQSAMASLDLATANEARMRNLFGQEYVSRQELDTAVQAKKAAEAQVLATRAVVEKDTANVAYTVIRSPVSGVVVDRAVDVGQTVAASLQTPTLFKIAQDLAQMQIHANFAEADIGSIKVNQVVKFTVDAFPNRNFQGEVRQVRLNPTTQQNVVTYDVVINVDNPEQILMPGMTAYVNIAVNERKDALLVPNAALRFKPASAPTSAPNGMGKKNGDKTKRDGFSGKVYVFENGEPVAISVSLGITDGRNTEIVGGELKAGDQIIIDDTLAGNKPTAAAAAAKPPMRMF